MQTELYRRQHDQLRGLLRDTSDHLVPLDADACRSRLARLATLLSVHLALEDQALYPHLMKHDNAKIREIAGEYRTRMGRLSSDFRLFAEKWSQGDRIESAQYDFAVEYGAISEAVLERMDLEDSTLYALVDMVP